MLRAMNARLILCAALVTTTLIAACGSDVATETGSTTSSSSTTSTGSSSSSTSSSGAGGIGGAGGSGGVGNAGGSGGAEPVCPSGTDACTTCLSMQCASPYCVCYGDLACGALLKCTSACAGDAACVQGCFTSHPSAISEALLLGDCAAAQCPAACPKAEALSPCQACSFTKCPNAANTCLANAECQALLACAKPCNGDQTCIESCGAAHPSGYMDAQALSFCVKNNCSSVCQ